MTVSQLLIFCGIIHSIKLGHGRANLFKIVYVNIMIAQIYGVPFSLVNMYDIHALELPVMGPSNLKSYGTNCPE